MTAVAEERPTKADETASASTALVLPPMPRMSLQQKLTYAKELADSRLLPDSFKRQPANLLWAVEYAEMLGLHPMAAVLGIHVIKGKPTLSAGMMTMLVRRAGHRLRVKLTYDDQGFPIAHAYLTRLDDPDFTFESRWDIHRAIRAELCEIGRDGKIKARSTDGNALSWQKYTENMVKHRATSEVCRDGAEEALFGVHYTPEEMGAEVDEDGNLVAYPKDAPEGAADARARGYAAERAARDGDGIQDADVVEDPNYTAEERKAMLMDEMAVVAEILGRTMAGTAYTLMTRLGKVTDEQARDKQVVLKALEDASPDELLRVLGPMRASVAGALFSKGKAEAERLTGEGQDEEARRVRRVFEEAGRRYGTFSPERVAPVAQLFGPYLTLTADQAADAPADGAGADGGGAPAPETGTGAFEGADVVEEEPDAGPQVGPHAFVMGEPNPFVCGVEGCLMDEGNPIHIG